MKSTFGSKQKKPELFGREGVSGKSVFGRNESRPRSFGSSEKRPKSFGSKGAKVRSFSDSKDRALKGRVKGELDK